jgi:hypothetical protein
MVARRKLPHWRCHCFAFLLQQAKIVTMRKGATGITTGSFTDYTCYAQITNA